MKALFTINENKQSEKFKDVVTWGGMVSYKITSRIKRVIGLTEESGIVIKENAKTVLVSYNGRIIKRHKVRHNVKLRELTK